MFNKFALFILTVFFQRNGLTRAEDQAIIQAMDVIRSKIYPDWQGGMAGWYNIKDRAPQDYKQVLVTDGTEFRVLHREEGSWAFTVSPCNRDAMTWWKELK